jgi:dipeptidyl aminopeptidase/acylaminoacyl peptidase
MKKSTARNAVFLCFVSFVAIFASSSFAKAPVEAFARLPVLAALSVSPDGKYIAAKVNTKGKYAVAVFEVNGNQIEAKFKATVDDMEPQWTRWASPTRVLISSGAATHRFGTPLYETRLTAINFDGSKQRVLIRGENSSYFFAWNIQIQDRVTDYLPDDPDHIIMSYNKDDPGRPKPHRVDIYSGKGKSLVGGRANIHNWMTDRTGAVRLGRGRTKDGFNIVEARGTDGGTWRRIHASTVASGHLFYPIGFSPDPDVFLVLSNHEGPTSGLYEYRISTQSFLRKLHQHPEVDIENVWMNEKTGRLKRSTIWIDGPKNKWFDPKTESISKKLETKFPDKTITIVSTSTDDRVWVARISSDTDPGQYIVYDRAAKNAVSLGPNYPELESVKLSRVIPIEYRASDGMNIPAYLTLPPDISSAGQASNLPLVVMPHGGPTVRSYRKFDPFAQLIASRGIAVLQMNFRGSGGFGTHHLNAGHGQWGRRMQDDITDGANQLINQGIADPNRICILGGPLGGYGGYAAIMGAIRTPDFFRCAIGWNGLYDLKEYIADQRTYLANGRLAFLQAAIGDIKNDTLLKSISPSERADEIKIPVLLTASKSNRIIPSKQSDIMVSALKAANVDFEYLEVEDGGWAYMSTRSRLAFMTALEKFLVKHLSP